MASAPATSDGPLQVPVPNLSINWVLGHGVQERLMHAWSSRGCRLLHYHQFSPESWQFPRERILPGALFARERIMALPLFRLGELPRAEFRRLHGVRKHLTQAASERLHSTMKNIRRPAWGSVLLQSLPRNPHTISAQTVRSMREMCGGKLTEGADRIPLQWEHLYRFYNHNKSRLTFIITCKIITHNTVKGTNLCLFNWGSLFFEITSSCVVYNQKY